MSKQLRYGGTYADFAKALVNLDGILENAVLIEQHMSCALIWSQKRAARTI